MNSNNRASYLGRVAKDNITARQMSIVSYTTYLASSAATLHNRLQPRIIISFPLPASLIIISHHSEYERAKSSILLHLMWKQGRLHREEKHHGHKHKLLHAIGVSAC